MQEYEKLFSPEESIFYSIWYTMETAAQVGWLLHTQKASLFTWLAVASLQGICILPFLWACIIGCICGQNHSQGQILLLGMQMRPLWKEKGFEFASAGAKSGPCQLSILRCWVLKLQPVQHANQRASKRDWGGCSSTPILFFQDSAIPRWILQQYPPYCIFTLLVPHSFKNLQQSSSLLAENGCRHLAKVFRNI